MTGKKMDFQSLFVVITFLGRKLFVTHQRRRNYVTDLNWTYVWKRLNNALARVFWFNHYKTNMWDDVVILLIVREKHLGQELKKSYDNKEWLKIQFLLSFADSNIYLETNCQNTDNRSFIFGFSFWK